MLTHSETIGEIAKALATAQASITSASRDGRGNYGSYATLQSVVDACREHLTAQSIAVIQSPGKIEGSQLQISTMLLHASGEWLRGEFWLPCPQVTPQGAGSAITYARRYSLMAMLNVPADDDDGQDAENAARNKPTPPQKPAPRQQAQPSQSAENVTTGNKTVTNTQSTLETLRADFRPFMSTVEWTPPVLARALGIEEAFATSLYKDDTPRWGKMDEGQLRRLIHYAQKGEPLKEAVNA